MPAIKDWIESATTELTAVGIASAKLDAEIILAHTLRKNRTYLHGHNDETLTPRDTDIANARLDLRMNRVPIAYIIGHKEFYGRRFKVTTSTLIPRPESEDMIDVLKDLVPKNTSLFSEIIRLVDVGTGTGCLGITAKLELPDLDVSLLDISPYALKVAAANAQSFNTDVRIIKSDLLTQFPLKPTIIIANLPYVDEEWERSPETDHEPAIALFADNHGLDLIIKLINQSSNALTKNGYLILEADPVQHDEIIAYATRKKFQLATKNNYCIAFIKTA